VLYFEEYRDDFDLQNYIRVELVNWTSENDDAYILQHRAKVDGEWALAPFRKVLTVNSAAHAIRQAIALFDELLENHPNLDKDLKVERE
jgi:hypothetical protein